MTRSRSRTNPRTRAKRRILILISVLVIIAATSPFWSEYLIRTFSNEVLSEGDCFRIECVTISGARIVPADSIRALAQITTGMPIFDLPLAVVEKRICRHPWILRATATRQLPNRIEITVVERDPVAAIQTNSFYVVTADSVALIPPSGNWVWDLPILTPPRSIQLKNGERVADRPTLALLREVLIAIRVQSDLRENLSEMYYRDGNIHAALAHPPVELNLGNGVSDLTWIGLKNYLAANPLPTTNMNSAYIDIHIAGKLIVKPANLMSEESAKG